MLLVSLYQEKSIEKFIAWVSKWFVLISRKINQRQQREIRKINCCNFWSVMLGKKIKERSKTQLKLWDKSLKFHCVFFFFFFLGHLLVKHSLLLSSSLLSAVFMIWAYEQDISAILKAMTAKENALNRPVVDSIWYLIYHTSLLFSESTKLHVNIWRRENFKEDN